MPTFKIDNMASPDNSIAQAEFSASFITKTEILRRITPAEWHAFTISTDPNAVYAMAVFNSLPPAGMDRNDPMTTPLFQSLEALGILAAGRAKEILT